MTSRFRTLFAGAALFAALPAFAAQPFVALDDRLDVPMNAEDASLDVTANDQDEENPWVLINLGGGGLHGDAYLSGQVLVYEPDPGFVGDDFVDYTICNNPGECDTARVYISVRPLLPQAFDVAASAGRRTLAVDWLPALPAARFDATPLVAPVAVDFDLPGPDPTPRDPFDGPAGRDVVVRTLAAGGGRSWVVVERSGGDQRPLLLGIDANGDGLPAADELRCVTDADHGCTVEVDTTGAAVAYWVMAHTPRDEQTADVSARIFEIVDAAGDGTLFATGPGHAPAAADIDLTLAYDGDALSPGVDVRTGIVTVRAQPGSAIGSFPVRVAVQAAVQRTPLPLQSGRAHEIALAPGEQHRLAFIDVPPGATRLRARAQADSDVNLYLVPQLDIVDPAVTAVALSPPLSTARDSATGPGADETVEVTGATLQPGRWYVVATSPGGGRPRVSLTATVDAVAPAVRDGSYYNPDRAGSGLFLYPAANQWAGLWYAYLPDGRPTWYYLQALQPGGNGIWTSAIYRSAWDGDSNALTAVGELTLTPAGADRFTLSYRLDGAAGTQPMEEFGRGCPLSSGNQLDLSSHWFDPARAGSGYSVQLFPNYEFYAAFYYDDRGYSRFVAAELNRFGGTQEDLVLQQLLGACPTCTYSSPVRTDIGLLTRRFLSGQFAYIATDLAFAPPLSGDWTVTDTVQLLGGPGTTQGCAL